MNNNQQPPAARPGRFVGLLRRAVGALQCAIPVGRSRKLAMGFFVFDGPREWGLGCIYYDGPNYYLAAGNFGFGWGVIDRPRPSGAKGPDHKHPAPDGKKPEPLTGAICGPWLGLFL